MMMMISLKVSSGSMGQQMTRRALCPLVPEHSSTKLSGSLTIARQLRHLYVPRTQCSSLSSGLEHSRAFHTSLYRFNRSATLSPEESEHLNASDSSASPSPSSHAASLSPGEEIGYLYFDSLFPIKLGFWDIRSLLVKTNHDSLKKTLQESLPKEDEVGYGFRILGAEERLKDGGAFLSFAFRPTNDSVQSREEALAVIERTLKQSLKRSYSTSQAMMLSWGTKPSVHAVKGKPWLEDLNRFPALRLKVTLTGGDVSEEALWGVLRPYGRIVSIDKKPNEALILFSRMRSATSARNCAHGLQLPEGPKLIINYQGAERFKKGWEWVTGHPRIVLPVVAFMLGGLTYAIFDPIRAFFIESKLSHTFDLGNYRLYNWLKKQTLELLLDESGEGKNRSGTGTEDWFERRAAKESIQDWLREAPETFITISGPRGSGKHKLLKASLPKQTKTLTIDCAEIAKGVGSGSSGMPSKASAGKDASSAAAAANSKVETALVAGLAQETNYWPVFGWLNSLNSMIDMAAVGLIGSKAGFSRPVEEQLGQILEVTTKALENVKTKEEKRIDKQKQRMKKTADGGAQKGNTSPARPAIARPLPGSPQKQSQQQEHQRTTEPSSAAKIQKDEDMLDEKTREEGDELPNTSGAAQEAARAANAVDEGLTVQAPVVIIDNFHLKSLRSPLLYNVLTDWASSLVASKLAHVVFVSDNAVAMSKEIGRALPDSRPANNVVLADAEKEKAREFVKSRLRELDSSLRQAQEVANSGSTPESDSSSNSSSSLLTRLTQGSSAPPPSSGSPATDGAGEVLPEQDALWVDKLGGRLTDLENLVQKVSLGQTVPTAVSELIARTTIELRKSFFGDDSSDSSSLPWSRGTAWSVIKLLSSSNDGCVPYHWMLYSDSGAFKGDEAKLRSMEEAELISVRHKDGRPSLIRAGRPVLLEAMRALVETDSTFRLTQDLLDGKSSLAKSHETIRSLESEMTSLVELSKVAGGKPGVAARMEGLMKKLEEEQRKSEEMEKKVGKIQNELRDLE